MSDSEVSAKLDKVIELLEQIARKVGPSILPRGGPDRYVARKVTAKDIWL